MNVLVRSKKVIRWHFDERFSSHLINAPPEANIRQNFQINIYLEFYKLRIYGTSNHECLTAQAQIVCNIIPIISL